MTATYNGDEPFGSAALDYLKAGWPSALPIPPRCKKPPPDGCTGRDGIDPSPADVYAWAEVKPAHNVALRLPENVIGIDVDGYDGKTGAETLAEAERRWGPLPATFVSTSRDDGVSGVRLFRVPTGLALPGELKLTLPDGRVVEHVELIRRSHRYLVVAPSIHPDGRVYGWLDPDGKPFDGIPLIEELPELPASWVEGLPTHNGTGSGSEQSSGQPPRLHTGPIRYGARDNALNSYAGRLRNRNLTLDEALTLMERRWADCAQPPEAPDVFSLDEALAKVFRAFDRYPPGEDVPEAVPYAPGSADGENPLLAGLRNGTWLDAQTFPELRYAVPGLLPEGSSLLVGPPKIGKSWFVLALALAVAAGSKALGAIEVGDKRPVLYLALEDGDRRLQDRCRRLLGDDEPIPSLFSYLTRATPGQIMDTIAAWLDRHDDAGALVILDTLGRVMPPAQPGESAYGRDYRIGSQLKRIADEHPGTSLLANHHDRKAGSEDFIDSVSGTHGLAGSADTILVLTRPRQETAGVIKVTGRDVDEREYAASFVYDKGWQLAGDSLDAAAQQARQTRVTAGVGDRMGEVIAFVLARPQGVGPTEIGKALGMEPNVVGTYLSRAVEAGRLRKPSRGRYTPVESVETVENPGQGDKGNQQSDE